MNLTVYHGRRNQGGKGGWSPPAIAEVLDRLIEAATAYDSLVVQCDCPECIRIHLMPPDPPRGRTEQIMLFSQPIILFSESQPINPV